MLTICITRLGTDHFCNVWMKLHQLFMRSSPDKFCEGGTDGQTDDEDGFHLLRRGNKKGRLEENVIKCEAMKGQGSSFGF
jgi:hypothetical protein